MIEWFARNSVAANILMFAIVIAGLISAITLVPVETFPSTERSQVIISTSFRGSTPKTAEDGVTLRIEEAIADIEGIDEIVSRSSEGSSRVTVDVDESYNTRDVLDDIKVRVDALNTLPSQAEKPVISIRIDNPAVIYVAISGDVGAKTLRETATRFRQGLLTNDNVSNIEIQGVADYEMTVEVSPATLDNYNISLADLGRAIRNGSADVSAGNVQTRDGDILIRSNGQAYSADAFARIPVIANSQGAPTTLGDIATIKDGFEESQLTTTFNGQPSVMLKVRRVGQQGAIQVAKDTRDYIVEFQRNLPSGVSIAYWDDDSGYLKSRIGAVVSSGLYGGFLVMLLLSLFLRPAVAFWVFLGIPVSFMGAFLFMPYAGASFNIISLFAFIMVLGIVVDDAIVTGENIYRKIREGHEPMDAAINGTKEIAVPVTFGILTTVVAFLPMAFLGNARLSFVAEQMPLVVIPILLMSLVESKLVLPAHLAHLKARNNASQISRFGRIQQGISRALERFVIQYYQPFLEKSLRNKSISLAILFAISTIIISWASMGHLKYSSFPSVESGTVRINLTMPESNGFETTDRYIQRISKVFQELQEKYRDPVTGQSIITNILATSGSSGQTIKPNVGSVAAELQLESDRSLAVGAAQIASEARAMIGEIPGAQSLNVRSDWFRTSAPINVELSGSDTERMSEVVFLLREKLKQYPAIYDIQDNYSGGKEELKIVLKPRAYSLGLNMNDVAQQVRSAVFGFQAQRIQRGHDELRVMVRYPIEFRSSIQDLNQLPIKVPNSTEEVLLSEIADTESFESPSSLYRLDRHSILNVTADVDKSIANVPLILADVDEFLRSLQQSYPDVSYQFDGEAEETAETNARLLLGISLVMIAIYALLAIPFKSYGQPLIVMSIIPFSLVGAILGHIITFQILTSLSFFGIVALVGVVVNDSLVLVDYINKRRAEGMELIAAVLKAGATRFRPVILTSVTTFAGVVPLLLDPSRQSQFLKPMATSLGFGILFATVITLIIVPINYVVAHKFKYMMIDLWQHWLEYWNRTEQSKTS
jgi:multidrug efflux pump subunit AcrB